MEVPLYLRISQDDMKPGESTNDAIERQRAECDALAASLGWTIGETFIDQGISATKGKERPEFKRLLATQPTKVVTWFIDRFVRLSPELEAVIKTNPEMDVRTVVPGFFDLSTPTGRLVARQVTAVSTFEGELKAERQRAKNRQVAASGYPFWRRAPFGHDVKGQATEPGKTAIPAAIADVLAGKALAEVAREWTDAGYPTPQGAPKWSAVAVRNVLTAPRVAGILEFKGERMPVSKIEPLVSESVWLQLKGVLSGNMRAGGGVTRSLLTGIAQCGTCDDGTTVRAGKGNYADGRQRKYQCTRYGHNGRRADEIETYIADETIKALLAGAGTPVASAELEEATAEVERLRQELGEWEAVAASLGPAEYMRVTQPVRDALKAAEERTASLARSSAFEGLALDTSTWAGLVDLGAAWQRWEALTLAQQRAAVQGVWEAVVILPGDRTSRSGFTPESVRLKRR